MMDATRRSYYPLLFVHRLVISNSDFLSSWKLFVNFFFFRGKLHLSVIII